MRSGPFTHHLQHGGPLIADVAADQGWAVGHHGVGDEVPDPQEDGPHEQAAGQPPPPPRPPGPLLGNMEVSAVGDT